MFITYKSINENGFINQYIRIKVLAVKDKKVLFGFSNPKYAIFGQLSQELRKMPKNDQAFNKLTK